ncbi:MAG: type II toxin-antitoxin system VapC family toxin [Micromonosporaceae bacterium]
MRLLLDSHIVLWWLTDDETLSDELKGYIDDEPEVYVSAVTIWEFAIKQAYGKIVEPQALPELIMDNWFRMLPVRPDHSIAAARLPHLHRDPFDRMLVAQAGGEELTLVTRDADILRYDVALLKA